MHDPLPVDVLQSFNDLQKHVLRVVLWQVLDAQGLQVHAKVATIREFRDLDRLVVEFEFFNQANDILVALTHLKRLVL